TGALSGARGARIMATLRQILLRHRRLAALVVVLALCLKALVPNGYMVGADDGRLTVMICNGADLAASEIVIPMKNTGGTEKQAGDSVACPYSALGHGTLGGVDPVLLAGAILFVLLLGFAPVSAPMLNRPAFRTPPLRGPPLAA